MKDVAITGFAVRTALGHTAEELCERLLAGERAAADNTRFDARTYACRLAASIDGEPAKSPHDRILRRTGRFAYHAAREALDRSAATTGLRLGLFSGVGGLRAHWNELMPAFAKQQPDLQNSWKQGFRRMHPYWMLQHLSNNTHALLSRDVDARGEGVTFGGANAGVQALASASRALADGAIDAALVVAYDSLIEPETVVEMAARGAAPTCDVNGLRAPYSPQPGGGVPGEAAAAVVLEPIDRARTRSADILAFISGSEAADGSPGYPGADAVGQIAGSLLGGVELGDGCLVIDGAALGVAALDAAERHALASVAGTEAPLLATQAALGQIGAAAALIQAIALAHFLKRGWLPAIAGLQESAAGPLQPLRQPTTTEARAALAISMGAPGLVGAVRIALRELV